MTVALPKLDEADLSPPDAAQAQFLARGLMSAVMGSGGPTHLQRLLVDTVTTSLTGHAVDGSIGGPLGPRAFAEGLSRRNLAFRRRVVQIMTLAALVMAPLPDDTVERVGAFADELGVDEALIAVTRSFAAGGKLLALVDFERNGYLDTVARHPALHTTQTLDDAWQTAPDDPALAARWASLAGLDQTTIGRQVWDFYRSRGFVVPGLPGSAPPLLAQHDWVHVLADYGTTVESEIEVFAFIARANDDPRAFGLLAMVLSLFETGQLARGAGLFEAAPGHLSRSGMVDRLGDALRRGALCNGSQDFLGCDWFAVADRPVSVLRTELGVPTKSADARRAGSVGPRQPGGISAFQRAAARRRSDGPAA